VGAKKINSFENSPQFCPAPITPIKEYDNFYFTVHEALLISGFVPEEKINLKEYHDLF
jgi:hypothetical protein